MALPYHVGDGFSALTVNLTNKAVPIVDVAEKNETVIGILLRANPNNTQTAYVGDANSQPYPLAAGETLSLRLSRRRLVYVKGTPGDQIIVLVVSTTGSPGHTFGEQVPARVPK